MSDPLRVGIVGAGANTKLRHIPGFQAIEGVEVVAVCNRSVESSQRVADEFDIPRIHETWESLVAGEAIDAVCIGTWPYLHAPITIAALEAGKHVLTEARMAMNLAEAERMLEVSRAHPDRVAQIVPAPFTLDLDAAIGRILEAGELGTIREVSATHAMPLFADPEAPLTWRQNFELSGYNTLTMGIYHEMVYRWLRKNPEWVVADGEVFSPFRTNPESGQKEEVKIPETVSVLGRFADGARLVYHFSGLEAGTGRNEIRINGSAACLRVDIAAGVLYRTRLGEAEMAVEIPEADKRGWQVEADFVASIRENAPVTLTNFEDGIRYMEFTEAVWQSVQNESAVTPLDRL